MNRLQRMKLQKINMRRIVTNPQAPHNKKKTLETLEDINFKLDKQISKERKRIESWDAKDFIFSSKYFCPVCATAEDGTCQVLEE